jgi:hypothetical protein
MTDDEPIHFKGDVENHSQDKSKSATIMGKNNSLALAS